MRILSAFILLSILWAIGSTWSEAGELQHPRRDAYHEYNLVKQRQAAQAAWQQQRDAEMREACKKYAADRRPKAPWSYRDPRLCAPYLQGGH